MSNLPDRRNSPRRRAGSGTHPGWTVLSLSWASGALSILALIAWARWGEGNYTLWPPLALTAFAIAFYFAAGFRAEKLR